MLSLEQVRANARTYMEQFFKIVDKSKTEVRWQSEWFDKFTLTEVLQLTSKFTVAQFLARDDFSSRYNDGRPIALIEFMYPLLQAYDSVAIEADVEFGGIDQKFNFLVGRELQSMMGQPPQQCFMTPLLVGTDGSQKMSKSLGNYIGVTDMPEDIYGKTMSIRDDLIIQYFELVTDVPDKELAEFKQALDNNAVNPMELKKRLGRELVTQLYDKKAAIEAEARFEQVHQRREVPEEMPQVKIKDLLERIRGYSLIEDEDIEEGLVGSGREVGKPETEEWYFPPVLLLCASGLAASRSEARRLIKQGAVRIDNKTIYEDYDKYVTIRVGSIINVGKRRFVKLSDSSSSREEGE
jgi:tyrosyl-tRNA synthetase